MHKRIVAAGVLLALAAAACSGGGSNGTTGANSVIPQSNHTVNSGRVALATGTNVVSNPGFETGSLSPWTSCGSTSKYSISTQYKHTGTYAVVLGSGSNPEVNGTAAVCQTVTVPSSGSLSFWVNEGTNDTVKYADQEADVQTTSGSNLKQLYKEAASTGGWVQRTYDVSAYAGQTVRLYFGVKGNGYSSGHIYLDLDDVSLTGSGSTSSPSPTPSPTVSPTATPTGGPTPTPTPTVAPTPTPTVAPTPTPVGSAAPCNDNKFLSDQAALGSNSLSGDQLEDVCGLVTQVLPAKTTSSGRHGYFYVQMPGGYNIEIYSNLDAMAQAPTNRPPTTWPWVSVGQYVYVQGRYFYDTPHPGGTQGIDWTEDDTGSWPYVGWVYVCDNSGNNCSKYW